MLNLTASMAVATKHLARTGFRPRGTLIYFAVADEEAGGDHGAQWVTDHRYDAVKADYVLTESGGVQMPTSGGTRVTVTTGEKGIAWRRLRVVGTPGHGSMPFGTDNALVKAAEVVRRLVAFRPRSQVTDTWRAYVAAARPPGRAGGRAHRPRPGVGDVRGHRRSPHRQARPRVHPHDVLAQRRARRREDERDPRRRRDRRRHPHAAGRDRGRRRGEPRRGARSAGTVRRGHGDPRTRRRRRRRRTRRCGTRSDGSSASSRRAPASSPA